MAGQIGHQQVDDLRDRPVGELVQQMSEQMSRWSRPRSTAAAPRECGG
jgi:hypothetical protein